MENSWLRQIDIYCERVDFAFWSEPLNAISNIAFLLAAAFVLVCAHRQQHRDWGVHWLVVLMVAIGIGSFLFHTLATRWAALADVIPIAIFKVSAVALVIDRGLRLPRWLTAGIAALFLPASELFGAASNAATGGALGGSSGYLGSLAALAVLSVLVRRAYPGAAKLLLGSTVLFALSLTLRTIDGPLCSYWPLGTHFGWHMLNSLVLALIGLAVLRLKRPG